MRGVSDPGRLVDTPSGSCHVLIVLFPPLPVPPQIWSVDDSEWSCKIDEGPAGISSARWSPDGTSLVLVADFQIRASIWSLLDRKCVIINRPKFADKGITFRSDGRVMAMLHVRATSRSAVKIMTPIERFSLIWWNGCGCIYSYCRLLKTYYMSTPITPPLAELLLICPW